MVAYAIPPIQQTSSLQPWLVLGWCFLRALMVVAFCWLTIGLDSGILLCEKNHKAIWECCSPPEDT
jgi:hypothetical protein